MDTSPSLAAVLAARDARADLQRRLLRDAPAVVSLTVVTPGPVKRTPTVERVFAAAATAVSTGLARRGWAAHVRVERHEETGPELLLAVRAAPTDLKRALVSLEEGHPWGRLWDLDVVTTDGPLSRTRTGSPPRACLVCDEPAAGCSRSRRHDPAAVAAAVDHIVRAEVTGSTPTGVTAGEHWRPDAEAIGALAAEALRTEARLSPKPGLVDVHGNGAHTDMTLKHFLASADALAPWLVAMADLGGRPGWTVEQLRDLGRQAEASMLAATGGVNTHRGGLHAIGWLCAVAGGAPSAAEPPPAGRGATGVGASRLTTRVGSLATPVLREWVAAVRAEASHGREAFRRHGLTGARGEAASGFRHVTAGALPSHRAARGRGWADDDALLAALVSLLARVDDTNLVSRGGIGALRAVQSWAGRLEASRPTPDALRLALAEADVTFSERRWSPGGSADLLSATWFLARLEDAGLGSAPRPGPDAGVRRGTTGATQEAR